MIKSLVQNIKLKAAALLIAVSCLASDAGIISSNNIVAGTQTLYVGRSKVYQIVAYSSTGNLLNFYDSAYSSNAYTQPAYIRSTNLIMSVTNVYTNDIFITATTTNMLLTTNIYLNANFRSNIVVNAAVVQSPLAASVPVIANVITSMEGLDLNFLWGITLTATNNATIIVYTRD